MRMVGDRDGRGRDGRMCAGAYGPYRCDRGVAGAGRSWGGRESWAWRGGAQRGDFRKGRARRFGNSGRGQAGQFCLPGGAGRAGPWEPTSGRWVWHEDGRQAQEQGKGEEADEFSEANGVLPSWRKALMGKWQWRSERAGMEVMLVRGVGAALGAQKRGMQWWLARRRCIVCYATRMNT